MNSRDYSTFSTNFGYKKLEHRVINVVTVATLLEPAGYRIINNVFCLDDFSEELDYLFEIIYLYSINSICIFACISFTLIDEDLKSSLSLILENISIIITALNVILANLVSAIVNLLLRHIPLINFLTNQAENAAAHTPFV